MKVTISLEALAPTAVGEAYRTDIHLDGKWAGTLAEYGTLSRMIKLIATGVMHTPGASLYVDGKMMVGAVGDMVEQDLSP